MRDLWQRDYKPVSDIFNKEYFIRSSQRYEGRQAGGFNSSEIKHFAISVSCCIGGELGCIMSFHVLFCSRKFFKSELILSCKREGKEIVII